MTIGQAKAKQCWFAFQKKVEDFFILGVIDFRKACI